MVQNYACPGVNFRVNHEISCAIHIVIQGGMAFLTLPLCI